jgi:putative peptidoglycan lipid II flippase
MNVVFINIFGPRMGVSGLAFAQALAICTISLLLFIQLNIKLKGIDYGRVIFTFIKTIFSGAVMGGIVLLLFGLFGKAGGSGNAILAVQILISSIVGAGVYIGLMSLLKVDEFKTVADMTFGKFIPRKKTVKV